MEKKNYIVAIDLGTSNVAVAVAEKRDDGLLDLKSLAVKPSQGVKAGLIDNIELVSNAIKAAKETVEEELGIRISEAYTGISGEFVRCARHTDHVFAYDPQNGVSRQDIEALFDRMRNVQAPDNETIMERIPQNYMVDDNREVQNPVGSFGKRLASTFNFILCEKTPIERLNLALRRLGIRSLGMCADALVAADAVLTPDEKEEGAAVVNLGGGVTDVAVYYRRVVRYIATIPMGAGAINSDIRTMGIPERHVEQLKRKYGWAVADQAPDDKMVSVKGRTARETKEVLLRNLAVVIESRARDIAEYVAQEIKDSGFGEKLAYGIVLTGGSAQLKGIDELFRRVTGMEVRIGSPEANLTPETQERAASPADATVVGLLLRGAEQGLCTVIDVPQPSRPAAPEAPQYRPPQPAQPRPAAPVPPAAPAAAPRPAAPQPAATAGFAAETPDPESVAETPAAGERPARRAEAHPQKRRDWGGFLRKAIDKLNDSFNSPEDEEI